MKPQNFEEKVIWYCIVGTYILYFLGLQYVLIPIMAWGLTLYVLKKLWQQTDTIPLEERVTIPTGVWVWIVSMLVMGIALVAGHFDFNYGTIRIVKSIINFFARAWLLFALFPLIGCLRIRPQLISRAVCILCLQSLIFIAIGYLAFYLGLPGKLYTSPVEKLGGLGINQYTVRLFFSHSSIFDVRLCLFAPWAPAIGLVGNIHFFLAYFETNRTWRWLGILGSAATILSSASRAAIVCLACVPLITWALANITRPRVQIPTGLTCFLSGLFSVQLISYLEDFKLYFNNLRSDSSQTRDILGRMALYQWRTQAPIWGHGFVPQTGTIVVDVPIGTHHTWFSLLFRHGIVGFSALVFPLLWSFVELVIRAQKSKWAKASLGIILVLYIFTFVENIDTLIYIYWPGLVMLGIAFKNHSVVY